jgi:hypothetical protein
MCLSEKPSGELMALSIASSSILPKNALIFSAIPERNHRYRHHGLLPMDYH